MYPFMLDQKKAISQIKLFIYITFSIWFQKFTSLNVQPFESIQPRFDCEPFIHFYDLPRFFAINHTICYLFNFLYI